MKSRYITTVFITGLLTLGSLALSPVTQAKPPSEDRGNGNSAAENVDALNLSTTGLDNTAHGWFSLFSNTSGSSNTADGFQALYSNTIGSVNTATGVGALLSNSDGSGNSAFGSNALALNTTGGGNTANGYRALYSNATGDGNTATGLNALYYNTSGFANTANGVEALYSNTTGEGNTALGDVALSSNTTGNFNTALGVLAGNNVTTADGVICIGSLGANVNNSCFIGHIRGVTTANADAIPVLIDSAGQLGTVSSSRRFKKEIKPMDSASESILALKPVTFHYKSDRTGTPQFGLIAEEVAEVNPDLVVRDEKGEIYTVRYDAVNAMLLNEFLKEHRKVEEQQATITELKSTRAQQQKDFQATVAHQQKQIEALSAGLQKVSAQLETSKPAPQLVNNNLSKAGWSWGYVSAVNAGGRTIFVADAHRDGGKRFVVRADEKLSAFMELESAICACGE